MNYFVFSSHATVIRSRILNISCSSFITSLFSTWILGGMFEKAFESLSVILDLSEGDSDSRASVVVSRYPAIDDAEIRSGNLLRALQLIIVGYLIPRASDIKRRVLLCRKSIVSTFFQKYACKVSSSFFIYANIAVEICICQLSSCNFRSLSLGKLILHI